MLITLKFERSSRLLLVRLEPNRTTGFRCIALNWNWISSSSLYIDPFDNSCFRCSLSRTVRLHAKNCVISRTAAPCSETMTFGSVELLPHDEEFQSMMTNYLYPCHVVFSLPCMRRQYHFKAKNVNKSGKKSLDTFHPCSAPVPKT